MEISVALDGVKKRNLVFHPGDDLSIVLRVYQHDGDSVPITTVTNVRFDAPAGSVPVGVPFSIPYNYIGRSPYRIVGDVAGITTTLVYGILQTASGWPSVNAWGSQPYPWGVVGKAENIKLLDANGYFTGPTNVEAAIAELAERVRVLGNGGTPEDPDAAEINAAYALAVSVTAYLNSLPYTVSTQ